jgi:signal transduction histidine kinase
MRLKFLLLFFCFPLLLWAQNNNPLETILLKAFGTQDSSVYYFNSAKNLLKTKADTANYFYFRFFRKNNDQENDSAVYFAERVIPMFESLDTLDRLRKVYEQLHYQNLYAGKYDAALNYIQKAITVAEKMKDTAMISLHTTDKANVYHDFEEYEKGVRIAKEAYNILYKHDSTNYKYLIFANNVIAINFDDWKKPDSALYYHNKNLPLIPKTNDTLRFGFVYNNIGNTLLKNKKFSEAKIYINKSLAINKLRGRTYNLATNYTNLATIAYEEGRYKDAIAFFKDANDFAQESQVIEKIRDVVQQEAWFYKKVGNFEKALERQEAFAVLRDSVFSEEQAKMVAEMETKYETEKKEKLLAKAHANLVQSELELRQKNTLFYGSLGLAFVLGLLGYLFYNQQKLKNRQLQKEGELITALARIETQNKLQEQRLRISRDLHDNIGSQLTFIISSIDNLKYGFKDMGDNLSERLTGISAFTSQTIYELRDTIWAMNKSTISFEDLQIRISNFIEKAGEALEQINFQFITSEEIALETNLSSVQGMNIYRIIQEAVNNALKHAEASSISVYIDIIGAAYNVRILDNGKGFDLTKAQEGNGLQNIKKRAKDMNGTVEIVTDEGKGTSVQITFPVSHKYDI